MRNKKLLLILTIFSLVVSCTLFLLSTGCHLVGIQSTAEEAEEELERIEAEQKAEEQVETNEAAPTEEIAVTEENSKEETTASEEAKSFPSEAITYTSIIAGSLVTIIVDFKTTEVTGSISHSGNTYRDATINGKINIDTLEITSNYSGIQRDEVLDEEIVLNGTITGKIADDFNTLKGVVVADFSDEGVEFTATRE